MKISPSLNVVREIAASGEYRVLPVSCDFLAALSTKKCQDGDHRRNCRMCCRHAGPCDKAGNGYGYF